MLGQTTDEMVFREMHEPREDRSERPTLPAAWRSDNYRDLIEPFTRQYAEAALDLIGGLGPGHSVIDIAAGTGAFSIAAAKTGATVLATDYSPDMVQSLKRALVSYPDGKAEIMDGQALTVPDGGFDAAVSIFGIMLFPDWNAGFAELARVVRPGGKGCVAIWENPVGAGPMPVFMNAYHAAFPDRETPPPVPAMRYLSDAENLKCEMARVGFTTLEVHVTEGVWVAPSVDWTMSNLFRIFGTVPLFAMLPDGDFGKLREALRAEFDKYASAETLRIPANANIILGVR
jgi:ubiquinone/menaquinone biosynthesis C-methylase UbiE